MKILVFTISLFISLIANSTTYYVAPLGDDDDLGTFEQPWATWQKAIRTARAGDTVFFRGGIYYTTSTQSCVPPAYGHSGTRAEPICYFNYPGEVPILDGINCTTTKSGLSFQGASNIHLKGLQVRNFLQHESDKSFGTCIAFSDGNNITIEQCVAYNAGMRGFYLHGCDTALLLNCDAFNCCDSLSIGYEGGGGDGFLVWDNGVAADSVNHIVLRGCRSWHNSDDGYDIETEGYIGVESCWAWNNGYLKGDGDGFKFGFKDHGTKGLSRQFANCLAVYNKSYGFDENSAGFQCMTAKVFNNTSYRNDQIGFATCNDCINPKINTYKNNIAYNDARSMPQPTGQMTDSYNSWNSPPGVTITDADFVSVDSTGISGQRKADGSLPDISFMKLAGSSDLIDAGTDAGLPYYGTAPDLGYIETNYVAEVLVTGIAVSGAGGAASITTSGGTLQLSASVLPGNGTNRTVTWSVINGTGQASVSSSGMVTATGNGTITVKAMANDGSGIYGTLDIAVSNQIIMISNITVTPEGGTPIILIEKETMQPGAAALQEMTGNRSIARYKFNGTEQAVQYDEALANADAYGIATATASTAANDNGTLQLHANVVPDSVTDKTVTWSITSGAEHATISPAGLITAVSFGNVTVTATANDGSGVKGTLEITIAEKTVWVESVSVFPLDGSIPVIREKNGRLQMKAEVIPANASNSDVNWDIENLSGIAIVDTNGVVTAVSDGSVKVVARATDDSGISGYCMVAMSGQTLPAYLNNTGDAGFYTFQLPGKLVIKSDNQPDGLICSVYTLQGTLIHCQKVVNDPVEIDIGAYPSGAYLVVLYTDQQVIPLKIVIP